MNTVMKKQKIYLVMAETDYEGSTPVKAFLDQAKAKEFAARCEAYKVKAPTAPAKIEDTPENDAEHEAFWKKRQRWTERHPAGKLHATCDSFSVMWLQLSDQ